MANVVKSFTTNNFIPDASTGKYVYSLSTSDTGITTQNYRVAKLLRKDSSENYNNVVLSYRIFEDKHLEIYSDEAFEGRLVLVTDT